MTPGKAKRYPGEKRQAKSRRINKCYLKHKRSMRRNGNDGNDLAKPYLDQVHVRQLKQPAKDSQEE